MAKRLGIYKCSICGNVVEVFVEGGGQLVCCGQPMQFMDEKTREGAGEKHLPVLEKVSGKVLVKIGSVPHPMEPTHWIQMIEVGTRDGYVLRKDLTPQDKPEALFDVDEASIQWVRELCNIHGLWVKE